MADSDPDAAERDGEDQLVDELRRVFELVDPVPENVLASARGSLTWRTIDAELAQLAYDSALDSEAVALVRATDTMRMLTFESREAPSFSVELGVTSAGSGYRVVGQLVPARPAEVEVRHGGGVLEAAADELGRFAVDGVARGPMSLVCRLDGRTIATDWLIVY
jgi:hypothetical protein